MTKTRIRIGLTRYGPGLAAQVAWATLAEDLGFDLIGYGDTQNMVPDSYVTMTAMALATRRILIGTTVSNPVTRHPAVTASGMAALQELSGDRIFFGIGTGDSAVHNIGAKAATLAELEAYCQTVRALAKGEAARFRGHETKLQWTPRPVPIWIAAEGPKTMALAGRIADGVIFAHGISEPVVKDSLRRIREAASAAGRDPAAVPCWFMAKPCYSDSPETAWHELAWTLAAGANHAFRFSFAGKFVPPEHESGLRRLMDGYASHQHNVMGEGNHNSRLVIENGLTGFLGPRFLLAGTKTQIVERIEQLADWGATNLIFNILFGDPVETTKLFAADILEPLKRNGYR